MFKRWVMPLDAAPDDEHLFATGGGAQREPPRERRTAASREQETNKTADIAGTSGEDGR
jgi:hypothetical protein